MKDVIEKIGLNESPIFCKRAESFCDIYDLYCGKWRKIYYDSPFYLWFYRTIQETSRCL